MISESLMAFMGTVTLLVITPGPNTAILLKNVPFHGKRKGLLNVLGIVCAINIHGVFAIFGVSSVLMASVTLFSILKFAGAVYLCILGVKTIVNSLQAGQEKKQSKSNSGQGEKGVLNNGFTEGLFTNLLNPKPALFYIAVFLQFFTSEASFHQIYFLVLIHSCIALVWYSIVVFGIRQLKGMFVKNDLFSKYFQRVTGIVFIYFGYLLATSRK